MDTITKEKRSWLMSRIKSKGTKPERKFHRLMARLGVPHKMQPDLPGKPDAVMFTVPAKVVFINGCFWHACSTHYKRPKTHKKFWDQKAKRNRQRQRESVKQLEELGYIVKVIWEHDL